MARKWIDSIVDKMWAGVDWAGGMSKRNKVGPVGGFAIPEVNRLMNAFIAGARETDRKAEVSISFIS